VSSSKSLNGGGWVSGVCEIRLVAGRTILDDEIVHRLARRALLQYIRSTAPRRFQVDALSRPSAGTAAEGRPVRLTGDTGCVRLPKGAVSEPGVRECSTTRRCPCLIDSHAELG